MDGLRTAPCTLTCTGGIEYNNITSAGGSAGGGVMSENGGGAGDRRPVMTSVREGMGRGVDDVK